MAVTVCSRIKDDEHGSAIPQGKATMVASYGTPRGLAYVRLIYGDLAKHFHIDCALGTFFDPDRPPKTTHKEEEVVETMSKFFGLAPDALLIGTFYVPVESLPETGFIRKLMNEEKMGGIGIKVTGATVLIEGTPIEEINWSIREDKKTTRIRIEGRNHEKFDEDYLTRCFKWVDANFSLVVLGRPNDRQ